MTSVLVSTRSLMDTFEGKTLAFVNDIENIHMVWLEEIQQEANRMFASDFSAEPELMPKTPSQKKSNRRKRVSMGRDENRTQRRFSKGKRSNLRRSSVSTVQALNLITEEATTSEVKAEEPKRSTRRNKQNQPETAVEQGQPIHSHHEAAPNSEQDQEPEKCQKEDSFKQGNTTPEKKETERELTSSVSQLPCASSSPPLSQMLEAVVKISAADRRSAELQMKPEPSPGRSATKIAIAGTPPGRRRSSVRHSLTLRRSLAGLRHSMTQESVRRASRRSFLKKKARGDSSTCSSNVSEDVCMETDGEEVVVETERVLSEEPAAAEISAESADSKDPSEEEEKMLLNVEALRIDAIRRVTRSMAQTTPTTLAPVSIINKNVVTPDSRSGSGSDGSGKKPTSQSSLRSGGSSKRRGADATGDLQSPPKKSSLPKRSQTAMKPNMRSFFQTVHKNQLLMMTPNSLGRNSVKSFIKPSTPLRVDMKERERMKLEALQKKQEQEEERKKKMEDEKKRKQEEIKRKRDERLRRVVEARVKEEQKDEEKKKKIEQKMAQIDEKNDKLRVDRLAEEKAKKRVATKRQEGLEQRRKMEEEARRKKNQQAEEEEKRQQELLAKRRIEEEQERIRKLAEARRALELKKEQERELERERHAAVERERLEREKAIALQREVERAAREKERRDIEERRKQLDEKRRQLDEKRREEQLKQAEEERAARQREVEKQREAAAAAAAASAAAASAAAAAAKNVPTLEVQHIGVKTPVGKGTALNVTVDIEQSPQSYEITPKGGSKPVNPNPNPEDYGMDQNSDDSTDDESAPRKAIPSWAEGHNLKQAVMKQYFNPVDLHTHFGEIDPPKLEHIFNKNKPRYFKRTSSAVWRSPPRMGTLPF